MALINENAVNTQLLKSDNIVFPALVVELVQLHLQALPGLFHLLDGEVFCFICLGLLDAPHDLLHLLLQNGPLALHAHGDLLKLRMADDDCIVVAGGDPAAEFLAVLGFKILFGGNEDIGGGIELQKLAGPLLR